MTAVAEAPAASAPVAAAATTSEEVALERATQWANEYAARLTERTMSRLAEVAGHSNGVQAHIGEPTTGSPATGFYVAFDVAATSPIQFGGPPPYQPSKVIAAGEPAFIVAFVFVNPAVSIPLGWAVPASVQLGGRTWRMTLDQGNLTTGTVLPRQVVSAAFGSAAATLTPVVFSLATPNPGPDPWLIEANVTVDIVDPGQPYAAFATNFLDVDNDPGFLFVPPASAGFRHELPNRYLIYSD
ncbi:MAG: hypothetical protein ACRDOH_21935 [Streptosporangiaceae bacterium]